MKKTFTLISILIAAIGSVYALIHFMKMDSFPFAWALNFILMLWVFAFTETLKSQHTSNYYNEKKWERSGKIYEYFGVNFFRKILVWTGWEKLNKKSNPIEKNTQALVKMHLQTKKSELGHFIILMIVFGVTVFVAFNFGVIKALWLFLLNILLNLYPVLLQRYNRPRLERAIKISKRRDGKTTH